MTVNNKKSITILAVLFCPSLVTAIATFGFSIHRFISYKLIYSTPPDKYTDVIFNLTYTAFAIAFLITAYLFTVKRMQTFFKTQMSNLFIFPLGMLLSIFPSWLIDYLIYYRKIIGSEPYPWEPYAMPWVCAIFYALPFALIGLIRIIRKN